MCCLLQEPGTADLTAWVDFSSLRQAVSERRVGVRASGPIQQGHFLLANGIEQRVDALIQVLRYAGKTSSLMFCLRRVHAYALLLHVAMKHLQHFKLSTGHITLAHMLRCTSLCMCLQAPGRTAKEAEALEDALARLVAGTAHHAQGMGETYKVRTSCVC